MDEQQLIFGGKSLENTQRRVFGVCFLGLGDGQKDAKKVAGLVCRHQAFGLGLCSERRRRGSGSL